jgi:uncharacterized membrane protein
MCFPPPIKLTATIQLILLIVALNTINPYNDRHKSSFHEMMMVPVLYQIITISWICFYNANKLKQNLSQVTDKLLSHNIVSSTPRHERGSNSQF